jgi:predicted NAD/FAD-binding protein
MLVRFWINHHLLDIFQRPVWRVVSNRSETYVKRILRDLDVVSTGVGAASVQKKKEDGECCIIPITSVSV